MEQAGACARVRACAYILALQLGALNKERQVAYDHIQIGVAPMRVVAEKVLEDGAKCGLVLGDEARPLVKEQPQRAATSRVFVPVLHLATSQM